ncbi:MULTISPECIES: hypothetical protein [unclassified Streptomyces]|uniref:hypothetical protein n=1 Tax=Streptomyces sp. NPDC127129 TaxID=3345373 RepID=UPI0036383ED6
MTMQKTRLRLLGAIATLFAVTSCTEEAPPQAGRPDNYLCDISAKSTEEELLRQIMRAENFTTNLNNRESRFVEKMNENLQLFPDDTRMYAVSACQYLPNGQKGGGRTSIDYEWVPRVDASKPSQESGTFSYDFVNAFGTSSDVTSTLDVICVMPGDLRERSKKVSLHAEASYTVNLGPVHDHGTQDEQMTLLYLMARRATESLGCENKPLAKEPVVKPLATER